MSTIYAVDPFGFENIRYSRKLLKKALKLIKAAEESSGGGGEKRGRRDLEVYVYQNLSAVCNRLEEYENSLNYLELAYGFLTPDCMGIFFSRDVD